MFSLNSKVLMGHNPEKLFKSPENTASQSMTKSLT